MKIKIGDWIWHNDQAYQVDTIGDGQVAISYIDTPGIDVQTVDMSEIEVMTYDDIETARRVTTWTLRELRRELER